MKKEFGILLSKPIVRCTNLLPLKKVSQIEKSLIQKKY